MARVLILFLSGPVVVPLDVTELVITPFCYDPAPRRMPKPSTAATEDLLRGPAKLKLGRPGNTCVTTNQTTEIKLVLKVL